ncbi:MAG TPA: alpha/beta hydrolase, partial [Methylomirabilota bacterium]|nr:alpha/beta hydrolase [Methylomirabilota bacterium]
TAAIDRTVPSADGVPIHFRAEGKGNPAVVLVHGWATDGGIWEHQIDKIRRRHRVVVVDLAGHGKSGSGRTDWTIPAYAGDVRAVLEALDLRGAILVGHSMSGYVVVETARQAPTRVGALIPVDTLQDVEERPDPTEFEAFIDSLRRDFKGTAADFVRGMFPGEAERSVVERVVRQVQALSPEVGIPSLRGVAAFDIEAALAQVRQPIRCINATRPPTNLEVNRRYAPQFDAVLLEGVGHFPMLERPKEFNRLLERAIDGLASAASARGEGTS